MIEASALPSKVCAACGGRYPGDALFCPTDGAPLHGAVASERADRYLGQEISGHIEIRQLVGVGAMGRVYRAFQRGIDRDVAVKILHGELSANGQIVSRFTREAKVASRLQHPNVVQVLLAGQLPDRALYMVMEFLDGLSLQSALAAAGGALPLSRALHIALQICDATGEAHAQGVVHRDLKPENVMLVRRGADPDYVKVLDFGIARINWGEPSVATAAGLIFGTARYISPEGAQGNIVGPPSDVYSIGTLLFQMLSGRTPFDGDQAVGLLVQQIHDPPPQLRSIPRAAYVPEPIADVIMATLAKDPAKREPDARALGHALFDAAKLAGLSPDEFSRPMLRRQPSAMRMPPVERTKQLELTPDELERMGGIAVASSNAKGESDSGRDAGRKPATSATVKWTPPTEFQARLGEAMARSSPEEGASGLVRAADYGSEDVAAAPKPSRLRSPSSVDDTIDDMAAGALDPQGASVPSFPTSTPTPSFSGPHTVTGEPHDPGAPLPGRTRYTPPLPEVTRVPRPRERTASDLDVASTPRARPGSLPDEGPTRRRAWLLILVCFVLGAALAGGWAWKMGKIGPSGADPDEERFVSRATDAMFNNRFFEPPGENVKDITDEGLRRWPNDRRLLDVRVRAANELTSQAITQRSAGDVLEALKLARVAHELDPHDASAKRLIEQFEAEVASFSPPAAPTLTPALPPKAGDRLSNGASAKPSVPGPTPVPAPGPPQARLEYKALMEVSSSSPRLGQTVDLVARVAPVKGEFDAPGFTIVGPGVPGGVRMPAQSSGPGTFKASYAFLEPGRFEITFSIQESGKPISAKRSVSASAPAPDPRPPAPAPAPTPTGSVKWM